MRAFTSDLLIKFKKEIIQQETFAVSVPNVWRTIDNLVTKSLQPGASEAFCASTREVVIPFMSYKNLNESQANACIV